MKTVFFVIPAFIVLLVGCATPPPAPGMASLRVTVTAEPKTGVVTGNTHVLSYDTAKSPASGSGAFEHVDYAGLNDVVVWIDPANSPAYSKPILLNVAAGKAADSLAAAVGPGQSVFLHNSGSTALNLYSVSDGDDFDLGVLQTGDSKGFTAKSPGLIEVLTDGSRDPVALIYVAPSSAVQLTHAGQTVDFSNLPPGNYQIHSWHPRLPGRTVSVMLQADHVTDALIKVGVNELPKIDAP